MSEALAVMLYSFRAGERGPGDETVPPGQSRFPRVPKGTTVAPVKWLASAPASRTRIGPDAASQTRATRRMRWHDA